MQVFVSLSLSKLVHILSGTNFINSSGSSAKVVYISHLRCHGLSRISEFFDDAAIVSLGSISTLPSISTSIYSCIPLTGWRFCVNPFTICNEYLLQPWTYFVLCPLQRRVKDETPSVIYLHPPTLYHKTVSMSSIFNRIPKKQHHVQNSIATFVRSIQQ